MHLTLCIRLLCPLRLFFSPLPRLLRYLPLPLFGLSAPSHPLSPEHPSSRRLNLSRRALPIVTPFFQILPHQQRVGRNHTSVSLRDP